MPRSMMTGWESINLNGNGVDRYIGPTGGDCTVFSVDINMVMSDGAANPNFVGQAAILTRGYFTPTLPQFSPPTPTSKTVPAIIPINTDWGSATIYDPNGVASSGDPPGGWGFANFDDDKAGLGIFTVVMSAQLPEPNVVSKQIIFPSNFTLPAGSYFVLHVDELTIPAGANVNFESQATVFYG